MSLPHSRQFLGFLLLSLPFIPHPLDASDWMRFRGNDGSGVDALPGLPVDRLRENAAWIQPVEGTSHSSPVIFGDKLFYTAELPDQVDRRAVVCRSTQSGAELWKKSFPFTGYKKHAFNSFASSTPAVDADRLYVWWTHADFTEVLALDHGGEVTWKRNLGSFESQHGSGSSLVVVDDIVLVPKENLGSESFIAGLNAADGSIAWKYPLTGEKTPYSTPAIRRAGEVVEAVFSSTTNGIFSLDPKSGKRLWHFDPAFSERCVASPLPMGDELLFASCGQGSGGKESVVIRAKAGGAKAEQVYRIDRNLPYVPTPIYYEGMLFLVSDGGIVSCHNAKSGKLHWRERLLSNCFCSPVCLNGHLYLFGRDGRYVVINAADEFQKLGEGDVGAPVHAAPALGNGKLFIRTDRELLCIPGKDTA